MLGSPCETVRFRQFPAPLLPTPAMNPDLLRTILRGSESEILDFKRDQYPFESATDEAKSELLKDILAFANAWKMADAYIVVGASERDQRLDKLIGVTNPLPDHSIQQFVNCKTSAPISFNVFNLEFDSVPLTVIQIAKTQRRPISLKEPYGKLKRATVYVRRGSSTDQAGEEECEAMVVADEKADFERDEFRRKFEEIKDDLGGLREIASAQARVPMPPNDWPIAVAAYMRRTVDFAVVYDGAMDSEAKRGHEVFIAVSHGCIVGPSEVLTCTEALNLARDVAKAKGGRVVILAGWEQWEFCAEPGPEFCGLVICRLTQRNEEQFAEFKAMCRESGIEAFYKEPLQTSVDASVSSWVGHEIGFIHSGEVKDAMRFSGMTKLQFDTSVISHFRKAQPGVLKSFVSGVLSGRVTQAGSAVFTRAGTLIGIISECVSFPSDAGRRVVVKSLMGHPRFTAESKRKHAE